MPLSSAALQLQRLLNGLPLPDERISEAEKLIKECSEAELAQLGLGPPPRPVVPRSLIDGGKNGGDVKPSGGPQQRLHAVQVGCLGCEECEMHESSGDVPPPGMGQDYG
ncbi:hypothetical protein Vretimale_14563, partial [Volvox reticuliferus]